MKGGVDIRRYRESLRLDPTRIDSHNNLANVLLALQQFDEAVVEYRAALRLNRTFPEIWYNMGMACAAKEKRAEAIVCFREALRLDPGYEAAKRQLNALLRPQPTALPLDSR